MDFAGTWRRILRTLVQKYFLLKALFNALSDYDYPEPLPLFPTPGRSLFLRLKNCLTNNTTAEDDNWKNHSNSPLFHPSLSFLPHSTTQLWIHRHSLFLYLYMKPMAKGIHTSGNIADFSGPAVLAARRVSNQIQLRYYIKNSKQKKLPTKNNGLAKQSRST